MRLRFPMFVLVVLCAIAVLAGVVWLDGWPAASRLAQIVVPCFAGLAFLQWIWVGRAQRRYDEALNESVAHVRASRDEENNEPQLEAQPAPQPDIASEPAQVPRATVAPINTVDVAEPAAVAAANHSQVTVLDLKQSLADHVQAIRSMGNSINQRAKDPAFTQASALIVESADRIESEIGQVLARNDANAPGADLSDLLRNYIDQCKNREAKIRFTLRLAPNIDAVSAPVAAVIDLVVKGACENAISHAGATHIETNLRRVNGELEVQVADNGVGLPKQADNQAGSIKAMRERALALGGSFDIGKSRLGGVLVKTRIPAQAIAAPQVVNG